MYEIFAKLLSEREITAYRVAKETGIATATLSDWKNGKSVPKADKLQKIADFFDVPLDYLLGKEDNKKTLPEQSKSVSEKDIKIALFGGDGEVTDAMWEEAKTFVEYIKERERKKKDK